MIKKYFCTYFRIYIHFTKKTNVLISILIIFQLLKKLYS